MNKKGFTLVELLAVIVILAIIAIIAVPIILGVIDKTKKGAAESSTYGYMDAVEKQIAIDQTKDINNWVSGSYNVGDVNVKTKGTMPSGGKFFLNEKKYIESMDICISNYWVQYKNKKATVKGDCSKMDFSGPSITINETTLKTDMIMLNYTITDDSGVESVICEYGENENYGNQVNGTLDENGKCIFSGLNSGTKYYYNIKSTDKNFNQSNKKGSETTKNVCNVVTNIDGIIGDKYSCDPGDGIERYFYVISVSGENVTLLTTDSLATSSWNLAINTLTENTNGWTVSYSLPTMNQIYSINTSYSLKNTPWVYEGLGNGCAWTSDVWSANQLYAYAISGGSNNDIRTLPKGNTCAIRPVITVKSSQMS